MAATPSPLQPDLASTHRLVLTRAEGLHVWDRDGRRYLDATSGAFCVSLGYTRPDLVRAMTEAAERLPHARPSVFESEEGEAYSRELLAAAGASYARVVLTSSGSEAVDVALKISHRYQRAAGHPEREAVRYLGGHFHGATLGALGVTGLRARRAPYESLVGAERGGPSAYCRRCFRSLVYPACGLACAEVAFGRGADSDVGVSAGPRAAVGAPRSPVAAIILETIPAAGLGAPVPPPGYLARIRSLCDEAGALWIADEVLTGFGRVGALFAWQRLDVAAKPDIVVFGKGAGAGFAPVAGVLITDRVAQALDAEGFTHFQTYGGNPVAAAVGRRVLRAIAEEKIDARVRAAERALERALHPLRDLPSVYDVRGLGFLWGIELVEEHATGRPFPRERQIAERVAEACRERGVLVYVGTGCADGDLSNRGDRGDFILIAPPLIAGGESFKTIASVLIEAIASTLM